MYSSKSAIVSPGGSLVSRRAWMNSSVSGETSSAYTWSPSSSTTCGHSSGSDSAIRSAIARSASTSRPQSYSSGWSVNGCSCGYAVRHEPNTTRAVPCDPCVRSVLGGNGLSGSGHTCAPSSATV